MPYIPQEQRKVLDEIIDDAEFDLVPDGKLNYFLFKLMLRRRKIEGESYQFYKNYRAELLECAAEIEKILTFNKEKDFLTKNTWWHEEKLTDKQAITLSQKKFADIWEDKYENVNEISRGEASAMITYLFAMSAIYYNEKKMKTNKKEQYSKEIKNGY